MGSKDAGTVALPFVYDDGGRAAAGFRGIASDCVTRAVAIATGRPYHEVYDHINTYARQLGRNGRGRGQTSAREGVTKRDTRAIMAHYGFTWTPTMEIGSGCKVHLRPGELPGGTIVVQLSAHVSAVKDGVIHDSHNPARDGTRCVYGYWSMTDGETV